MKVVLYSITFLLLISCSTDPNQYYIDKIADKVRKNDLGLKITYRNIEFAWVDTLYAGGTDGKTTDTVLGYRARNTYRMIVGEIDQQVTATVTFDQNFNVIEIE